MKFLKRFSTISLGMLFLYQPSVIMAAEECSYRVENVSVNDTLFIRSGPGVKYQEVGALRYDASGIRITGPVLQIGESRWVPIQYQGIEGWTNQAYLKQDCQSGSQIIGDMLIDHTVESGETVVSISQRYGYSAKEIASWNELPAPYSLSVGQRLRIAPCSYRVVKVPANDMLWIRETSGVHSQRVGAIPYQGTAIEITGPAKMEGKTRWVPIKYKGITGWVNRGYLAASADCQQAIDEAADDCYRVIKVTSNDTLSIRSQPNTQSAKIGVIPYDGTGIQITGQLNKIGKSSWAPIAYEGLQGWVNRAYLADEVSCPEQNPFYDSYTVVAGDTLFSLSRRFGYSFNDIIRWNHLQPPYQLSVGQRLRIIPCYSRVINVAANDMLFIRSDPTVSSQRVGAIPYEGTDIKIIGVFQMVGKTRWVPIKYQGIEGWVNYSYLEQDCH